MNKKYNGKCPICRGQLVIEDGLVSCSLEPHYTIAQGDFENLWGDYVKAVAVLNLNDDNTSKQVAELSEQLIKDLLAANKAGAQNDSKNP